VPLANRDFIDANPLGPGRARTGELRAHGLLLQILDRVPVKIQLLGTSLQRGRSTAPANIVGKALRVLRVVGQERELLAFHLATTSAIDPPHGECEIELS
jgi:hypothetical protein